MRDCRGTDKLKVTHRLTPHLESLTNFVEQIVSTADGHLNFFPKNSVLPITYGSTVSAYFPETRQKTPRKGCLSDTCGIVSTVVRGDRLLHSNHK